MNRQFIKDMLNKYESSPSACILTWVHFHEADHVPDHISNEFYSRSEALNDAQRDHMIDSMNIHQIASLMEDIVEIMEEQQEFYED